MKKGIRKWDQRQCKKGKVKDAIADNILIAWPAMLMLIHDNHTGDARVLDYRCGTGGFCRHMRTSGLRVAGIDPSPILIRSALKRSSRQIRYHIGDKDALKEMKGAYDVITSIMDFQFMDNFETYLPIFRRMLRERGIIVFAVFNPDFVESCHRVNAVFPSLRPSKGMIIGRMETERGAIDTYVRTKEQYRDLFKKHGFEYLSSRYPPFTPEFIAQYKWKLPSDDAEYMVMAVRKR
jgi:2-polyprenyl-3-methyl-5-hydroxy-6-metoxy-1,4-benzoquinol methylase